MNPQLLSIRDPDSADYQALWSRQLDEQLLEPVRQWNVSHADEISTGASCEVASDCFYWDLSGSSPAESHAFPQIDFNLTINFLAEQIILDSDFMQLDNTNKRTAQIVAFPAENSGPDGKLKAEDPHAADPARGNGTEKRPYICSFPDCSFAFRYPKDLKRHQCTHDINAKRPYKCGLMDCKYSNVGFPRKDNLARHMRSKHSGIKWERVG